MLCKEQTDGAFPLATSKTIEERGRGIARLIIAKPFEVPAVISGFLLFFLLCGDMARP
jgi:hypothetical protein